MDEEIFSQLGFVESNGDDLNFTEEISVNSFKLLKGDRGDKGDKGDDGKDGKNGRNGKDAFVDYDLILEQVKPLIPQPVNGKDGKNGKNGKDGSPDSPEEIVRKIKISSTKISYNDLEDTPDIQAMIRLATRKSAAKGTSDSFTKYFINTSYVGQGEFLSIKAGSNITISGAMNGNKVEYTITGNPAASIGGPIIGGVATRVLYVDPDEIIAQSASFTFNGTTLSVPTITLSGLTAGRVPFVDTGGLLTDASSFTYDSTNRRLTITPSLFTTAQGYYYNGQFLIGQQTSTSGTSQLSLRVGKQYQSETLGNSNLGNRKTIVGVNAGSIFNAQASITLLGTEAGQGITGGSQSHMIGIGDSAMKATSTGVWSIAFGDSTSTSTFNNAYVFGHSMVSTADSQVLIGGFDVNSTYKVNSVILGHGATHASPVAVTLATTGGSGTNIAGSNFILASGISTGNATPASIIFQTTTVGSSGTTSQTLAERMRINGSTGSVWIGGTPTTEVAGLNIVRSTNGSALRMEVPATDSTVYDYYLGNTAGNAYTRMNYQRMELFRNGGSVFIAATGSSSNLEISSLSHVHIQNTSASGRSVFMGQAPATTTYKLSVQNNMQLWGTAPEFDIFNSSFVTYGRLAVGSSAFSIATVQAFPIAISINSGTQAARFTSTGQTLIGTHTTQSGTGQMEVRGSVISSATSPYITRFSTSTTDFLDVGINSSGQAVFTSSSTYYKFGGSSISFMEMRSVAGNVNIKFIDGGSLDVESGGTLSNSTNANKVFSVISAGVSTTAVGDVQNALITMLDARVSGSAGYAGIRVAGTINSGGSTSTVRGLYVNNTITAAFGYRAIEAVAGSGYFGFYQSGAGSNYFEGSVGVGVTPTLGKLHVKEATDGVAGGFTLENSGATQSFRTYLSSSLSGAEVVMTRGTTRFITLNSSNNTIIGGGSTAIAGFQLVVQSAADANVAIVGSGGTDAVLAYYAGSTQKGVIEYRASENSMRIIYGTTSRITSTGLWGINTALVDITAQFNITSATEQLRVSYNASNYYSTTVSATGAVTFDASGSSSSFLFADAVKMSSARFQESQGANVVAANDLTLGGDGNAFTITGNTQINAITTANWQSGSQIVLIFTGTPTVKHNTVGGAGTAVILLAGSADLSAAANTVLGLVWDGTQWQETFRKVA